MIQTELPRTINDLKPRFIMPIGRETEKARAHAANHDRRAESILCLCQGTRRRRSLENVCPPTCPQGADILFGLGSYVVWSGRGVLGPADPLRGPVQGRG